VRAVLTGGANLFDEISLFEPDPVRRQTTARLAVEVAAALGHPGVVRVTPDPEEAFTDASFVFSAIRVGGDQGRVIDEDVALRRDWSARRQPGRRCRYGLEDHPGRPFLLRQPGPVLAGRRAHQLHQPGGDNHPGALASRGGARSRVCDTPSGALERLGDFLGPSTRPFRSNTPGSTTWAGSPRSVWTEKKGSAT